MILVILFWVVCCLDGGSYCGGESEENVLVVFIGLFEGCNFGKFVVWVVEV